MAYTPLSTVATGDLWTAANHNTYVKDNFAAGVPDLFTTAGDTVYASGADAAARLAIGATSTFYQVVAGLPAWVANPIVVGAAPATPVANTIYTDSIVKFWCLFNGTGTPAITDDLNLASITDNGVGDYTLNFATNFASASYALAGSAVITSSARCIVTFQQGGSSNAVGSCRIDVRTDAGAAADAERVCVIIIGEQ